MDFELSLDDLKTHIEMLRMWANLPVFDVGDYRRQILAMADTYEDELKRREHDKKHNDI